LRTNNRKTKYAHEQSCDRVTMYNTRTVADVKQQKIKIKRLYHVKHLYYRR
jgi:hypothetical protein